MKKSTRVFISTILVVSGLYAVIEGFVLSHGIIGFILLITGVIMLVKISIMPNGDSKFSDIVHANPYAEIDGNKLSQDQKSPRVKSRKKSFKTESHNVAGTSYRQNDIKNMGFSNNNYNNKKSDFIEGFIEYEYNFHPKKVELIMEPDNPHDSNAIKVIIDGVHVGYIKRGSCSRIRNLINSSAIQSVSAHITGGNYKYLSNEHNKIIKNNRNFTVRLAFKIIDN